MLQSRAQFIALAIAVSIISAHGHNKALKALSVYNTDISSLGWQEFDYATKKIEDEGDLTASEREAVLNSKNHLNLVSGHHLNKISRRIIEWCTYANSTLPSVPLDATLRQRAQQRMQDFHNDIVKELGELLRELHSSSISICSSASNQNSFQISIELNDKTVHFEIVHGTPSHLEHIFKQLLQQLKSSNPMPARHSFQFVRTKRDIPYCRIQSSIESAIKTVERVLNELAAITDASPTDEDIQQILTECKAFRQSKHSAYVFSYFVSFSPQFFFYSFKLLILLFIGPSLDLITRTFSYATMKPFTTVTETGANNNMLTFSNKANGG